MADSRGTRLFVGNLSDKIKKDDIKAEFSKYGNLTSIWVAYNPPGFAFVEFERRGEAEKACDLLNGFVLLGSKLRVEVSNGRYRRGRRGGNDRGRRSGSGGGDRRYNDRGGNSYFRRSGWYGSGRGGGNSGRGDRSSGFNRRAVYGSNIRDNRPSRDRGGNYGTGSRNRFSSESEGRLRSRSPAKRRR